MNQIFQMRYHEFLTGQDQKVGISTIGIITTVQISLVIRTVTRLTIRLNILTSLCQSHLNILDGPLDQHKHHMG